MSQHRAGQEIHRVLGALPFAAYVCDAAGLITYFNARAVELWGREPKRNDARDRYCGSFKLFSPDGAPIPHDQCSMALTLRENRQFHGEEIVIERPDGQRFTGLVYASPLQDESGNLSGAVNVIVDISDRVRAHEAQTRLAAIVDSSDDAIVSKTLDGCIRSWNTGAERLFGYSAAEAIGQSINLIIPPERADEETSVLARLRNGERIDHYETVRQAKDGRRIDISLTISPIRDSGGRLIGASKVARDITLQKQFREALSEADRAKDEFLAILAHELRNPLAPIRNAVELLSALSPPSPESQWALGVIDRQTKQMVRLVDDLLDVARIRGKKLTLHRERVKLEDVLRAALETSRPLIDEAEHVLTVTATPHALYVDADPVRLAQAITNLLNNAAKYTERGGQIWLMAERQGSHAVVTVRDTGVGIAAEMLPGLFEMFLQVDRTLERSRGGLGIGLTLVKQIVELHGGTVEARSDGRDMGSEFIVRLPVAEKRSRPPRNRTSEHTEHTASTAARRILVVDDNLDLAKSLAMLLESTGNDVRTAHDGAEALEIASEFRPHAVALDVGLPIMNGFDVAKQLRQQPWGKQMILVAVTGWGQDQDRQRALESGFDHHMVKPVDPASLIKVLDASGG